MQTEIELWRVRLMNMLNSEQTKPAKSLLPEVGAALAKSLQDSDQKTVEELVTLLANVFGVHYTEASEHVNYTPNIIPEPKPLKRVRAIPLHGYLRRYAEWLDEQESPTQYHVFSLLTLLSAAIKRRTHTLIGPYPIFTNLYVILIGPSGSRKDSAIDVARVVVDKALCDAHVLPVEGSIQGITDDLRDRYNKTGVCDGILLVEELRVLMGSKGESYKSDIPIWLTDWFKCKDYWKRRLTNGKIIELFNLYICLLGGTTMEWLNEMPSSMLKGGFFARTMPIWADNKSHWNFWPSIDLKSGGVLAEDLQAAMKTLPAKMILRHDALAIFKSWYEDNIAKRVFSPHVQDFVQRIHVHAIKLAMLINILEGRGAYITKTTAEYAIALSEWIIDNSDIVFANLGGDPRSSIYGSILRYVARAGGKSTYRKISRGLRNEYRASDVRQALQELTFQKDLYTLTSGGERIYVLSQTLTT